MARQVALLRAINVAGKNMVAMNDLREMLENLGFQDVQSLLQSGNLVFRSDRRAGAELEKLLETETAERLKINCDYFVRSASEWAEIVPQNPFPREAERDPGHLVVMFLKSAPKATAVKSLQAAIQGPEYLRAKGQQLYLVYPAGIGRSKLTNSLIEKHLGTSGTVRNWNTVLKLAALVNNDTGACPVNLPP
jgi:uncharacterized protein (DUF1697 family)